MKHNVVEKARSSNTCPVHDIIWQTTAIIPDVQVEKERLLWIASSISYREDFIQDLRFENWTTNYYIAGRFSCSIYISLIFFIT